MLPLLFFFSSIFSFCPSKAVSAASHGSQESSSAQAYQPDSTFHQTRHNQIVFLSYLFDLKRLNTERQAELAAFTELDQKSVHASYASQIAALEKEISGRSELLSSLEKNIQGLDDVDDEDGISQDRILSTFEMHQTDLQKDLKKLSKELEECEKRIASFTPSYLADNSEDILQRNALQVDVARISQVLDGLKRQVQYHTKVFPEKGLATFSQAKHCERVLEAHLAELGEQISDAQTNYDLLREQELKASASNSHSFDFEGLKKRYFRLRTPSNACPQTMHD